MPGRGLQSGGRDRAEARRWINYDLRLVSQLTVASPNVREPQQTALHEGARGGLPVPPGEKLTPAETMRKGRSDFNRTSKTYTATSSL